jgi:glycosyltransferase involved in cell wall biosynthesis
MKKYPYRLLILDGYTVELSSDGQILFSNTFHGFYEKMAEIYSSIVLVVPHRDLKAGKKLNIIHRRNMSFYLLPYFSDPIHFFKRLPFDVITTIKGLWLAMDSCDACLLRFPSPVLPLIYFIAIMKSKKVVLFVMGTWADTVKLLPWTVASMAKRALVGVYEIFHKIMVRRHCTISTYPYLELNLPNVNFAFISPLQKETMPVFTEIKEFKSKINILFVGRLTEAKGIFDMLVALKTIRRDRNDILLHIVGDGYLLNKINAYALDNNLQNYIVIHGHLKWNKLEEVYREADIFVLPSYTEGVPKVVLEAMVYGVPVIATRVGALPILFQHGTDCLFVNVGDVQQLTESIRQLLAQPEHGRKLAASAYRKCLKYNLSDTSRKIGDLIYECIRK